MRPREVAFLISSSMSVLRFFFVVFLYFNNESIRGSQRVLGRVAYFRLVLKLGDLDNAIDDLTCSVARRFVLAVLSCLI
jgi:hypothetical protein